MEVQIEPPFPIIWVMFPVWWEWGGISFIVALSDEKESGEELYCYIVTLGCL